ncbi:hypothetical protein [Polluticoccus soli]|uniref:hypothetical protein n=1 Tax=Polluticoccus soli TaxID=3034150 RepID=UPI0023E223AF|nr:hypothetical protein [Flavipsychrobacter sp. JY13-12]
MRNTILILLLCCLVSCSKKTNPTTPTNPPVNTPTSKYIPNWYSGDTLYGMLTDTMGQFTGKYDTVYTKTVADTSFIIYNGVQYYIWWSPLTSTDTFKNDQLQYSNMAISATKDTTGIVSHNLLNSATPHKYKDQQGVTNHQKQLILVNDRSKINFKAWNGSYQSRTTH